MTLGPGSRLGPYEVVALLGAGGMGEVWRAHDDRLSRDVAIKVLPASVASDEDRLARFRREAQLLAQLSHPNIGAIYGLEEAEGVRGLVLELIEGETLAARLAGGALPPDEAMALARQVAAALEAAHEKGIIHRDLKPANVKVTPTGEVKVLDFGLAKAMDSGGGSSPDLSHSPTLTAAPTGAGAILGTASYMSPEQARGRPVDRRTDLWALGCLLFELLTGKLAFAGETATDVLAAIVTRDPDWSALPASTPAGARRLLRICLEKDPRRRLRDAGDAALMLGDTGIEAPPPPVATAASVPGWRQALPWGLTAVLAVLLVAVLLARGGSPSGGVSPPGSAHLAVVLPARVPLSLAEAVTEWPVLALSPDGSKLAIVAGSGGNRRLYLRHIDGAEILPLPGTEGASSPFFSPDGEWVAFFARGKLMKLSLAGGNPVEIASTSFNRGGAWGPDGTIVYSPTSTSPLLAISSAGGEPRELTHLDAARQERSHRWPAFLPGGRDIVFTIGVLDKPAEYDDAEIGVVTLASGARRTLLTGASIVRPAGPDHLILGRGGQLLVLESKAATGGASADAVPVLKDVEGVSSSGVLFFDVSENGTLAYLQRSSSSRELELGWFDRDGRFDPLPCPVREYHEPRFSPDGRRIAVSIGPGRGGDSDLWVHDLASGSLTRATFDGRSRNPLWTPDGRRLSYSTEEKNHSVFAWRAADGGDSGETIATFENSAPRAPIDWTPDGGQLIYIEDRGPGHQLDILGFSRGDGRSFPVVATSGLESGGDVSPDGRWLAYASLESGRAEVYVQAFPGPGGRWQVSEEGGGFPRWSPDGRSLYFVQGTALMEVPVSTRPGFTPGRPRVLLQGRFIANSEGSANYDIAPDGRILIVRPRAAESNTGQVDVILNWFETLRRAAARPR